MFFSKYITKKTLWISVSIVCVIVVVVPTTVVLTHNKKIESNPTTTTEKPNLPTTKVFSTSTDAETTIPTTTTYSTTEKTHATTQQTTSTTKETNSSTETTDAATEITIPTTTTYSTTEKTTSTTKETNTSTEKTDPATEEPNSPTTKTFTTSTNDTTIPTTTPYSTTEKIHTTTQITTSKTKETPFITETDATTKKTDPVTKDPNTPTTKIFSTSTDASSSRVTTTTTTTTESPGNGCEINPSAIKTSPVLLHSGTSDIIYPEPGSNTTKFTTNQLVDFACLGNKLNLNGQTVVTAACMNKETFRINGQTVEWKNLKCSGNVVPNITQVTDLSEDDTMQSCYNNKEQNNSNRTIATIGFNLPDGRSIVIIKICFDFDNKITLFSNYILTSAIGSSFKDVQTYRFSQDTPIYKYSVSLRNWYQNNQTTINRILGFSNESTNYVNNIIYINTGHIAANTDFMYSALQVATYRFINAAPQWNTIDVGNWNQIEMSVRNYSISAKKNLQIWTGIYGICSLANFTSHPQNVFIYYDPRNPLYSPTVPIPEVFWKLVYNPDNQQGIVFVTHNNPYDSQTNLICDNDISDQISWLNVDLKDYKKGYSYSCQYNDPKFQKIVDYVPQIEVKGILL